MNEIINIAEGLDLPINAITQTFAQIGKRGAGKTYLASMIAEQMLDAKAQIIVIDPIGNWWGLRVNTDGKTKGKDIFVIGGTHGDISIVPEAGSEIAKLLVEKNISVILDISEFRKNERKKFVTEFAEEFYQLKKTKPSPVHIFLEEAQKFVPQRIDKDEARMLGAWEDIVRLGRNYGIGCSLISQRPQSVNKEVLSQVECLCVLQTTGTHERKALEEWIQEAGEDRKIVGYLPGLNQGEGYVWSPTWLKIFKKVKFNKKTTLDTSATPELGKTMKVAQISEIDVDKLREYMKGIIEETKIKLKEKKDFEEEIKRLKAELKKATTKTGSTVNPTRLSIKEVKVTNEEEIAKAYDKGARDMETKYLNIIKPLEDNVRGLKNPIQKIINDATNLLQSKAFSIVADIPRQKIELSKYTPKRNVPAPVPVFVKIKTNLPKTDTEDISEKGLGICAKKIYSFLYNNPDREFTRGQVGAMTGYSYKSGGFSNAVSSLNTAGLVIVGKSTLQVKELNSDIAGEYDFSIKNMIALLGKCEKAIYEFLLDNPDIEFSREEIAQNIFNNNGENYSPTSGGFSNSISRLSTLGLIERTRNGIKLHPGLLEFQ